MILKLIKYYFSLLYWDRASLKSVKKMQLRKFREIFEYARENSRFYKELYTKHGVMDLKIESFEDIQKVPIVNKSILREFEINDIGTCEIDDSLNIHSTSGSTGEPFKIAYSKFEDYSSHVRLTREMMKYGYNPFKRMVLLSRYDNQHKFEVEGDVRLLQKLQKYLRFFPKDVISIFDPLPEVIKQLKEIKPYMIWSTPSYIHLLALELQKNDQKLNVPLCVLMAETISSEQLKLFRERVCKNVMDAYGCMEIPSMGFSYNSIDYKNLVVNTTFAEVINQRINNEAKIGDIIITNLINKTMPFIRYELGDFVGVLNEVEFPVKKIGKVHGRFEDILTMIDGSTLSFHQTYQLFHDFNEVLQYKFIQLNDKNVVLQLRLKNLEESDKVKQIAEKKWRKYFPNVPLRIEFTDNFVIDKKTGKFKVIEKSK